MSRLFEAFCVRLAVDKPERVGGDHLGVELFAMGVIENVLQTLVGANPKVIIAAMADLQVFIQVLLVEMLAALVTADEDILSTNDAFRVANRLDLAFFLTKPGHKKLRSDQMSEISTRSQLSRFDWQG